MSAVRRRDAEDPGVPRLEPARMLELIGAHVRELIAIKTRDGRYLWANHAFAVATGRSPQDVVGATDLQLFEPPTAALFDRRDREAVVIGATLTEDEFVRLDGERRRLETSRVPVLDTDGRVRATITIARDVTELCEAREAAASRRERAVAALVQAIETVDPDLVGHSATMIAVLLRIVPLLGLGDADRDRLVVAAQLSQIGKLFIPRRLLRAQRPLTEAELARVHAHHARVEPILAAIDLDPDVTAAVAQIGERFDGTGHPHGLAGNAIHPLARVLGAVDAYVALTSRRARRPAAAPAEALATMGRAPSGFDPDVLAALARIVPPQGVRRRRPDRARTPPASGSSPRRAARRTRA